MALAIRTARLPNAKAETWTCHQARLFSIARAAPNPAPAETPSKSGETMGFLNSVWYDAPAAERAPPVRIASRMRGRRTPRTTVSSVGSPFGAAIPRRERTISARVPGEIAKRPTRKARIPPARMSR